MNGALQSRGTQATVLAGFFLIILDAALFQGGVDELREFLAEPARNSALLAGLAILIRARWPRTANPDPHPPPPQRDIPA